MPGEINATIGYTGSRGKDMFLRGVGNTLDPTTRTRRRRCPTARPSPTHRRAPSATCSGRSSVGLGTARQTQISVRYSF
jgi:hypothetical protein